MRRVTVAEYIEDAISLREWLLSIVLLAASLYPLGVFDRRLKDANNGMHCPDELILHAPSNWSAEYLLRWVSRSGGPGPVWDFYVYGDSLFPVAFQFFVLTTLTVSLPEPFSFSWMLPAAGLAADVVLENGSILYLAVQDDAAVRRLAPYCSSFTLLKWFVIALECGALLIAANEVFAAVREGFVSDDKDGDKDD